MTATLHQSIHKDTQSYTKALIDKAFANGTKVKQVFSNADPVAQATAPAKFMPSLLAPSVRQERPVLRKEKRK